MTFTIFYYIIMNKKIYNTPDIRPLAVMLERGFAVSAEAGFGLPSYDNEDVSNNWK